jgi:nickel-dependent lactate racemase
VHPPAAARVQDAVMTSALDLRGADVAGGAKLLGGPEVVLTDDQIRGFVHDALETVDLDGRSVCVLVPDSTRSCPLPLLLRAVRDGLVGRATRVTVMVALGTHPAMDDDQLADLLGESKGQLGAGFPGWSIVNHAWWDPNAMTVIGEITAADVREISQGRLAEDVVVRVNRAAVEHDVTLVVGPVFPHEVVGFSGGNKYLFPGISGQEMIDVSHWLGALISSSTIIGTSGITPVRALIDRAASMVPGPRLAFTHVVRPGSRQLNAIAFGTTEAAWAAAAEVSASVHIRYLQAPVARVLSIVPHRYDEMWTAAKAMYKVEPIVADGGEIIVYGPHVREISRTFGEQIKAIGYHCREYFTAQWPQFRDVPRGVIGHSSHLRGAGTFDLATGEHCRFTVTLATGIDEATTRAVGLNYLDPASVDVDSYAADPGTLVVPDAGEQLYRLGSPAG